MINKKLLQAVPEVMPCIQMNILLQWLALLCAVGCWTILAWLVQELFSGVRTNPVLLVSGFVVLLAGRYTFTVLAHKASVQASRLAKKRLRLQLVERLTEMSPECLAGWNSSELVQLAGEGIDQLESYFANYVPQFFYALLAPVTLFVITLFLDVPAAFALLVCVPLIPASIVAVQKFAKRLLARYWTKYTSLGDSFLENLQGLTTLKIYQADGRRHEQMNREAEEFRKITMRVLVMQLNSISVMDLVAYGGAALGMVLAVSAFAGGHTDIFQTVLIIVLASEYFLPMRLLGSYFHIAMNGQAAADKMFAVMEAPVMKEAGIVPESLEITADHLTFSYDGRRSVLDDVSFAFPAKGLVAAAGISGAGKSTIASLLCQKVQDKSGALKIGNVPVGQIDPVWLQKNVSVLDHQAFLFKGSVRDNLLLADERATEAQMQEALLQAGIEIGLDHPVLENGANLSGGMRQRIALARALLKNAPILILDEATSAVDAASENTIMEKVQGLKDRLVLVISHRMKNIEAAETIVVLEDGRASEAGSHAGLLAQQGVYARLWSEQQKLEKYGKE